MKREDIAKKYGISTGSVSAIVEECEEEIPDIHKLRAMILKIIATGNSPETFYHAIRLHNYTTSQGITEADAERILEIFQEYAFKRNYNISELIDALIGAYEIAAKYRTDLAHLKEYADAKKVELELMIAQKRKLRSDIEFLPYKLSIDLAEFQEYQRNKPTLQKFMNLKIELDIKDRRINLLEEAMRDLNLENREKDREIERLKRLHIQQKKEDGNYKYYQDITNLDSTDYLVDDDDSYENNNMETS
jgi:hypothetical protein